MNNHSQASERPLQHECLWIWPTRLALSALCFHRAILITSLAAAYEPSQIIPPKPLREFRGVWIATVGNIDWPSRKGLTTSEQKAELTALLDCAARLTLNAVIFQVRPACDALYASSLEPWSEYLSGTMGKPPQPFYDPLAFAIDEAHKRGLELHAWFNPFRARHLTAKSGVAANHISRSHPELVRQYGTQLWLDPGEKSVQDHTVAVVLDVVRRYDIDGVHFDDYFYPYHEKGRAGNDLDFPDEPSWKRFGSGGGLSRDDWRRENVNGFIHRVYESIKAVKPWVKFGISPFGIWRPGSPTQVKGFDAYGELYADSRKWLAEGWVDYLAPQLYWSIHSPEQSFGALLQWWSQQNVKRRHLFPGLDATKMNGKWKPQELVDQIRLTRRESGAPGHIHWDIKALASNRSAAAVLQRQTYLEPALAPPSPWLGNAPMAKPRITVSQGDKRGPLRIQWSAGGSVRPRLWLLQTLSGTQWKSEILTGERSSRTWDSPAPDVIAISAVDRSENASGATAVRLRQQ